MLCGNNHWIITPNLTRSIQIDLWPGGLKSYLWQPALHLLAWHTASNSIHLIAVLYNLKLALSCIDYFRYLHIIYDNGLDTRLLCGDHARQIEDYCGHFRNHYGML